MALSYSLEDYIEEIYNQVLDEGHAKVTRISNALDVRKASVTGALNALAEKKLINYEPYAPITLTKEGEKIARTILQKHRVILDFFGNVLGIPETEALETACKMEHIVSEKIFKHMTKFNEFIKKESAKSSEFKERIAGLYE
jgi:DtxR family Mn-dependent transcriptional regulator